MIKSVFYNRDSLLHVPQSYHFFTRFGSADRLRSLHPDQTADVGELIECLERGKVVDVESLDLVANGGEGRVVQLEEAESHRPVGCLLPGGGG